MAKRVVLKMGCKVINSIQIAVTGTISDEELAIYLDQIQSKQKRSIISATVTVDGEHVDVQYKLEPVLFERIRRITGYLVGTTARWGDGKRAELKDRVMHN